MTSREFHYRWDWHLRSSPESLWPLVADTNRFNRDTGLPAVEAPAGNGAPSAGPRARRLRFRSRTVRVEWQEEPFEWVYPSRFGVVRRYSRGPAAEMRVLAELTAHSGGGTQLVYQVWVRPRNLLGLLTFPFRIGVVSARSFDAAFRRYDQLAASGQPSIDRPSGARLAPGGRERLLALRERLLTEGAEPSVLAQLVQTIESADDITLSRLRPYALADYWVVPRRQALELCLWATRVGLLDFQWDLLCPLCRGAKETAPTLRLIQPQVHCDACNIDFTVNFDRQVELTFRPNPAIRPIETAAFCIGGPQVTPHVMAQQLMNPGEKRTLTPVLEAGRYRLRTLSLPGGQFLQVTADGAPEAHLRAAADGWPRDELHIAPSAAWHFENATDSEQLFVLERTAWSDGATTAAEVTTLQLFRDLFADEALRPGEHVSVGALAVVFTDLRGSTRLYREIGDAVAFGRVMNHFDVLRGAIAAEDGALVKTIGDAVMAVFRRPAAALRAMLSAQQTLAAPPDDMLPLPLKAGIHYGPCIAVTLNERLDYFGSTVNLASRLEGLSNGGDVIVSDVVRNDPEIAEWLSREGRLKAECLESTLKGFGDERFDLWRITPRLEVEL